MSRHSYSVRLARPDELHLIPAIESSAGRLFKSVDALASLADDDPMSTEELGGILDEAGSLTGVGAGVWLIVESVPPLTPSMSAGSSERAIGFLAARSLDKDYLHIAEMSVSSEHQGKGAGGTLLDFVISLAESSQSTPWKGISLTTYPDLKFNGKFYAKHGFQEVDSHQLGPQHAHRLKSEKQELGLERKGWRRACMVRWIE